jgi:hypothetical protein
MQKVLALVPLLAVTSLLTVSGDAPASDRTDAVPMKDYTDSNWACHGTVRRKNGTEAHFKLKDIGPTDTINGAMNIVRARHRAAGATTPEIDCYHYSEEPIFKDDDGLAGGDQVVSTKTCREKCEDQRTEAEAKCRQIPEGEKKRREACWRAANEAYAKCVKDCDD